VRSLESAGLFLVSDVTDLGVCGISAGPWFGSFYEISAGVAVVGATGVPMNLPFRMIWQTK